MAFSKLGTNYSSSSKGAKGGDKAPLLGVGGGDSKLEDVQGELNDLLAKLSQVQFCLETKKIIKILIPSSI